MLNRVILIGRLTADAELKKTQNDISVTSFTVAVNRPYVKGKEQEADFIDVVVWRKTAEFVCNYFEKGKPIMVEGKLQVRNYTAKDGTKRKVTEVVADNVSFVEGSKGKSESKEESQGQSNDDFTEVDTQDLPF